MRTQSLNNSITAYLMPWEPKLVLSFEITRFYSF